MVPKALSSLFRRDLDPAKYRLEIDGLRFFAIMTVLIGHLMERVQRFWLEPNPQLDNPVFNSVIHFFASPSEGVCLFFAISGFIIAKQMQDVSPDKFDLNYVGKFYFRRIMRIFPPYYLILLVTFIAIAVLGFGPMGSVRFNDSEASLTTSLLASLAYVHGIFLNSMPRLFPLGWSLEMEVQFYLLTPLLFLLLRGSEATRPLRYGAMLVVFTILSYVCILNIAKVPYLTILSFMFYFTVGIIIARYETETARLFRFIGTWPSLLLGIGCWLALFYLGHNQLLLSTAAPLKWLAEFIIIFAMFGMSFQPHTLFGKFCRLPGITYIGMACYSLYLVHMQVFQILAIGMAKLFIVDYALIVWGSVVAMAVGLVAGAGFFMLIEKPFAVRDWHKNVFKSLKSLVTTNR